MKILWELVWLLFLVLGLYSGLVKGDISHAAMSWALSALAYGYYLDEKKQDK